MTHYRDKSVLEELYLDEQMTMGAIGEVFGCTTQTIHKWLKRHGIPTRSLVSNEEMPWRNEQRLRQLHDDEDLGTSEIAERLGCHPDTIRRWLKRFQNEGKNPSPSQETDAPTNHDWKDGYEVVRTWPDEILVHRLVAVAEYGLDYVDDWSQYHVHHKNGVKWDNRPSNLEVLTPSEHTRLHAAERRAKSAGT